MPDYIEEDTYLPYAGKEDRDRCIANGLDTYVTRVFKLLTDLAASHELADYHNGFNTDKTELSTTYKEYSTENFKPGHIIAAFYYKLDFYDDNDVKKGDTLYFSLTLTKDEAGKSVYLLNGNWNDVVMDEAVNILKDDSDTFLFFTFSQILIFLDIFKPALTLNQAVKYTYILLERGIIPNSEYAIEISNQNILYHLQFNEYDQTFVSIVYCQMFIRKDDERIEAVLSTQISNIATEEPILKLALVCPTISSHDVQETIVKVNDEIANPEQITFIAKDLLMGNPLYISQQKIADDLKDLDLLD